MIVQDSTKHTRFLETYKLHFAIVLFVLYSVLLISVTLVTYKTGYFGYFLKPMLKNCTIVPRNYLKSLTVTPKHIGIDVKYMNLQKLAYKREQALKDHVLITSAEDYVPARIRFNDVILKARIRLKGDWVRAFRRDKWSYRVKLSGDNTIMGMKRFSLHHPMERSYIHEWIYHRALQREDVLSLRYKFVTADLNGKDLGIYAVEEHFDKRLVEHARRREGPIVKLDEDVTWRDRRQDFPLYDSDSTGLQSYYSSNVDAFRMTSTLSDPNLYKQFLTAVTLLHAFRDQKRSTSQVFDMDKLAVFLAVTDLTGSMHGLDFINMRFYYNPVTSLLEPIGFDGNAGSQIGFLSCSGRVTYGKSAQDREAFVDLFFKDEVFFKKYVQALERVSDEAYLESLFHDIEADLNANLSILYREFPYYRFSERVYRLNQVCIRKVLNPAKGFHAYFLNKTDSGIRLEIGNIQSMPVKITRLMYKNSLEFEPAQEIVLPGRKVSTPIDYRTVEFRVPDNVIWSEDMVAELTVQYGLLGSNRSREESVFPWPRTNESFVIDSVLHQLPNAHQFDFLLVDEPGRVIRVKPGRWDVGQDMMVPEGYRFSCGKGTELNLMGSAVIVSRSPVDFTGTEEEPVRITSEDSSGQGLVVLGASGKSTLKHVTFDGIRNPAREGWDLTGAVTFYKSDVYIDFCRFLNNKSEDALNIIRSEYSIDRTLFKNVESDAFDSDFSHGVISRTSFVECGNDGIDTSGSRVEMRDIAVTAAGDKGISVGEGSQVTASDIRIENAEIAMASKDMSELAVEKGAIVDSKVGFAVYKKKSEYGPSLLRATGIELANVDNPHLVEKESTLIVDARTVTSDQEKVKEILYGVVYGKGKN